MRVYLDAQLPLLICVADLRRKMLKKQRHCSFMRIFATAIIRAPLNELHAVLRIFKGYDSSSEAADEDAKITGLKIL